MKRSTVRQALILLVLQVSLFAASVDKDGMLVIDGRREFVFGLYQLPQAPNAYAEARTAGFRVVHVANAGELEEARSAGLLTWMTVGSLHPTDGGKSEARIREMVRAARENTSLLWWETEDEPTYTYGKPGQIRFTPEQLIETRNLVHRLDPGRLFYLNHSPTNLVSTLRAYNAATDIVAADIYPVIPYEVRDLYGLWEDGQQGDFSNREIGQVGQYADKMRDVAGPDKPVFMVLQAFAWEAFRKTPDPKLVVFPTFEQTRFMAYQAIVHGVNGLLYFAGTPIQPAMWAHLKRLLEEMSGIKSDLAKPKAHTPVTLDYHDTGHSIDRGIEWIVKGDLLIAVNADKNPVDVTFHANGQYWRQRFAPFEVRLRRLHPV